MCTSPLIRAETFETYTNKKGGISYKVEWLERDMFDKEVGNKKNALYDILPRYRRVTPVGCGQCHECLLNYSRNWATRLMLHKDNGFFDGEKYGPYPEGTCWFITLTYANEHLKTHHTVNTETGELHEGTTLYIKDMQNFWKRLRKKFTKYKISYFECGEYGHNPDGTSRPHYHAIVFGVPFDQTQFKKVGMCKAMKTPRWTSKELEDIWGMGIVDIGRVTWESCGYVARYALKKVDGYNKDWYAAQGRLPEFVAMSKGFSKAYFEKNKNKMYETDSVPIVNKKTGANVKPPLYFDRMLKETDPELYESVKSARRKQAESNELILRQQTNLTPEERRKISEERMQRVIKDLRKEV